MSPRNRKDVDKEQYHEALELAEMIEKLRTLPFKTQRTELMKVVRHQNPNISTWAIGSLELDPSPNTATFLRKLAVDPPVTCLSQIVLDQALCARLGGDWMDSQARVAFFEKWANGKYADEETAIMLHGIYSRGKRDAVWLKPAVGAKLVGIAATNPKNAMMVRNEALLLLPRFTSSFGVTIPVFQPLIEVLTSEQSKTLRLSAAKSLADAAESTCVATRQTEAVPDNIRREVNNIAQNETNPQVAHALKKAVSSLEESKKP